MTVPRTVTISQLLYFPWHASVSNILALETNRWPTTITDKTSKRSVPYIVLEKIYTCVYNWMSRCLAREHMDCLCLHFKYDIVLHRSGAIVVFCYSHYPFYYHLILCNLYFSRAVGHLLMSSWLHSWIDVKLQVQIVALNRWQYARLHYLMYGSNVTHCWMYDRLKQTGFCFSNKSEKLLRIFQQKAVE